VHAAPGDSGGPIICTQPNGNLLQIATTMERGHLLGSKGSPYYHFTYSRHEMTSFNADWINKTADLPALSHHF
jgi:hypothetical protein